MLCADGCDWRWGAHRNRYEDGEVGPLVDRRIRGVAGGKWGGRGFADDSALLGEDADSFGDVEEEDADEVGNLFDGIGQARNMPQGEAGGLDNAEDSDAYSESGFGEQGNLHSPDRDAGDDYSADEGGEGGFDDSLPFEPAGSSAATVRHPSGAADTIATRGRSSESKSASGSVGWLSNRVLLSDGYMARCRVRGQLYTPQRVRARWRGFICLCWNVETGRMCPFFCVWWCA